MGDLKLADVVDRLRSALPEAGGAWDARFSTGPEAWMTNDENQIGLFQEENGVRVVVWVGSDLRSLQVDSEEKLKYLPEWIVPQLAAQTKTSARLAEEEKKRAAIQPPPLETVLEALRGGKRVQLGVGRWYCTYFIDNGKLRREVFDEGLTTEEDAAEKDLTDSLAAHAQQARVALSRGH